MPLTLDSVAVQVEAMAVGLGSGEEKVALAESEVRAAVEGVEEGVKDQEEQATAVAGRAELE